MNVFILTAILNGALHGIINTSFSKGYCPCEAGHKKGVLKRSIGGMTDVLQAPGNSGTIHRESELKITRCEDGVTGTKVQPEHPMCEFETILAEATVSHKTCPDISSIP